MLCNVYMYFKYLINARGKVKLDPRMKVFYIFLVFSMIKYYSSIRNKKLESCFVCSFVLNHLNRLIKKSYCTGTRTRKQTFLTRKTPNMIFRLPYVRWIRAIQLIKIFSP